MEPVPEIDLRERLVRAADQRRARSPRARSDRRNVTSAGGALGRGARPAARERDESLRRPAATVVYRARAGERAGSAPARRAGERARSDLDSARRGATV